MNYRIVILPVVTALMCAASPEAQAKGPAKGKKGNPPPAKAPASGPNASPKAQLTPYIDRITDLLALQRGKNGPFLSQAPGHLTSMRSDFSARQAQASGPDADKLAASVATCDALIGALNERQQVYAQISGNTAVHSSGDLGRRRKDNFSEGTVGGPLPQYADVREQARRERKRNMELKQQAAETDQFMTKSAVNRWNQHSLELQQRILALYGRIG